MIAIDHLAIVMNEPIEYMFNYDAVGDAIRRKYAEWGKVYQQIEFETRELQHQITVRRPNLYEVLVTVLYTRMLSNVSAAILVLERGFDVQCRILLRAAMESMFNLAAIANSPEQGQKLVVADSIERKGIFTKSPSCSRPKLDRMVSDDSVDDRLREVETAILELDAKRISYEDMARAAGLEDWYLTVYAAFSASVHSNVGDLKHHLAFSRNRANEAIRNESIRDGLDILYLQGSEILLKGLEVLGEVFKVNNETFRAEKFARLEALTGCGQICQLDTRPTFG